MLNNFHLVALIKERNDIILQRIPIVGDLQRKLAVEWTEQLASFCRDMQEVAFEPGYSPEAHERFSLQDFQLPANLARYNSTNIRLLDPLDITDARFQLAKAVLGFATDNDREIVLIQSFNKSHIIEPGRFLFLTRDNFESSDKSAITLDPHLTAIYYPAEQKLLFRNFRAMNAIIDLEDYYDEATEEEIKEILSHDKLAPENVDVLAKGASQWFSKRFAMLKNSRILDEYAVEQIVQHSAGFELNIQTVENNGQRQIVFPAAKAPAKKLLQFLNEELFRGAITDRLFETNSKRVAD